MTTDQPNKKPICPPFVCSFVLFCCFRYSRSLQLVTRECEYANNKGLIVHTKHTSQHCGQREMHSYHLFAKQNTLLIFLVHVCVCVRCAVCVRLRASY